MAQESSAASSLSEKIKVPQTRQGKLLQTSPVNPDAVKDALKRIGHSAQGGRHTQRFLALGAAAGDDSTPEAAEAAV